MEKPRITSKQVLETGLLALNAVTSPVSLVSESLRVPFVKSGIEEVVRRTTRTKEREDVESGLYDSWFGGITRGGGDVIAVFGSAKEAVKQAQRNIRKEVNQLASAQIGEVKDTVKISNENIFNNVKRTFGFSLGLFGDYVSGGYNEALFGVPIPGVSNLRDNLFSHVPFLEHNPLLFGAFAAVAGLGLLSGIVNVVQDGRFSRQANKIIIDRLS